MTPQMDPEVRLQMMALGVPGWLDLFKKFNSIQAWAIAIIAAILTFNESIWGGIGFYATYTVVRAMILAAGSTAAHNSNSAGPFVAAVITAIVCILVLNIAAATYLLGYWRFQ